MVVLIIFTLLKDFALWFHFVSPLFIRLVSNNRFFWLKQKLAGIKKGVRKGGKTMKKGIIFQKVSDPSDISYSCASL